MLELVLAGLEIVVAVLVLIALWRIRHAVTTFQPQTPRELPTEHTWHSPPTEIIRLDGAYDRWTCTDCQSFVDLRRGDSRTF